MLLSEVMVNIALSEVSEVRLIVSIPVLLISKTRLPLFLRAPMLVWVMAEGESVTVPEFISRVPAIDEPALRERESLTTVVPAPEIVFAKLPERFNVPVLVIVPPRFSAEEVIVAEFETLPEIAALFVKVPEFETSPVIPVPPLVNVPALVTSPVMAELLVNEPSVTEMSAVIPVPPLVKVPALWVIRD